MYINPFLAGVLTTIVVEIAALFIAACVTTAKNARKRRNMYDN